MSYPADPKTLQVLDRIIAILKEIAAGTDYFYPVGGNVIKGVIPYDTITSFPFDMVYLGPEHSAPEYQMDGLILKFPTIQIEAYVDAKGEDDTVTKLIKHLRDVCKAINDDTKPGAGAGSLGAIAVYAKVGIAITDDAELAGEGKAAFKLSVNCRVDGDWGEL